MAGKPKPSTKRYFVMRPAYFKGRYYSKSNPGESVQLAADVKAPEAFWDLTKGPPPNGGLPKPAITAKMLKKSNFADQEAEEAEAAAQAAAAAAEKSEKKDTGAAGSEGAKTE